MGIFSSGTSRLMLGMGLGGAGIGLISSDSGDRLRPMLIGAALGAGGAYALGRYARSFGQEVKMASNRAANIDIAASVSKAKKGARMASNQSVAVGGMRTGGGAYMNPGISWQARMSANNFPGTSMPISGMLAGSQSHITAPPSPAWSRGIRHNYWPGT